MASTEYISVIETGLVHNGACLLAAVLLQAPADDVITVYDGLSNTNPVFKVQWNDAGSCTPIVFKYPIVFQYGIYVELNSVEASLTFILA